MTIKDLLFPKFCLGCGFMGAYICPRCFKKITLVKDTTCIGCGKESGNSLNHYSCLKRLNANEGVAIFKYEGLLRKIVKNTKYRLAKEILEEFLKNIRPEQFKRLVKLNKTLSGALIQPIPLSKKRLRARGFNQSYILGKYFSSVLGLKMADFMVRKYDNAPQAEVRSRVERFRNVRGAFGLKPGVRIRNKKIVIVDDVMTTGATASEVAKVLKRAGALKIYLVVLTRD